MVGVVVFFFFQAEDGIRDIGVTGVQTCALPIYRRQGTALARGEHPSSRSRLKAQLQKGGRRPVGCAGLGGRAYIL